MPPPGYEPFLAAILARPADDTPRLVYADWLDDHDDPARAEFIRLQIAAAVSPGRFPGRHRVDELRKAHQAAWKAELPALRKVDWGGFRRGFVAGVSFYERPGLTDALSEAFAAAPIETVRLVYSRPGMLAAVAGSPVVGRVREVIGLSGFVGERDILDLAASPAANLEVLECGGGYWHYAGTDRVRAQTVTDAAVLALADSPGLRRLWRVRVGGAAFRPETEARLRERFGFGYEPLPPL